MTLCTVTQAKSCICPIARVSGAVLPLAHCIGQACLLWRWTPILMSDPRCKSAIEREIMAVKSEDKGEKPMSDMAAAKLATARVAADKDGYIIRTDEDKGWCGLGGVPS